MMSPLVSLPLLRATLLLTTLCLGLIATGCTEEPASSRPSTQDQGDTPQDMADDQAPDLLDAPDLMNDLDEPDLKAINMPDLVQDMNADMPQDMANDQGGDQGDDDLDMDTDLAQNMSDMSDMADMLMFPDLPDYPCAYPADPASNCPAGDHGPGSFVTTFTIVEDRTCCRDFDDDGDNENFIGNTLISTARTSFGVDVNANIDEAISTGELAFVFEFEDWQNDRFDPQITARIVNGTDTNDSIADNFQGFGSFYPTAESYDEVTGLPRWGFQNAYVYDGELIAEGGTLRIYFPGIVDDVQIVLEDVQVKATVSPGANLATGGGVTMSDGELSGAIVRDRFFESLNTFAQSCPCIADPIFQLKPNGSYECLLERDRCQMSTDRACRLTGQRSFCAGLALFSGSVDVDLDKDGTRDAFGFGARFTSIQSSIEARP